MKKILIYIVSLFISSIFVTQAQESSCRYAMTEQNGIYFIYKQVSGDLPQKDEIFVTTLEQGIHDVIIKKEDQTTRNIRIKVRTFGEQKDEAKKYLETRCNQE